MFDNDDTSTPGGSNSYRESTSVGYTDCVGYEMYPVDESYVSHVEDLYEVPLIGYGSVFLNGVQLVRTTLPSMGTDSTVIMPAEDMNVTGEVGGISLDVLFSVTHNPDPLYEWYATLECFMQDGTSFVLDLGFLRSAKESSHFSHYIRGQPLDFKLNIHHTPVMNGRFGPAEHQLVKEVKAVLENNRLNRGCGSIGSIVLNNKLKESVLYERVVGKGYGGSWQDFVKAHPEDFILFHYSEQDVMDNHFAPQIKRSDARLCVTHRDFKAVREADRMKCAKQRRDEEEMKSCLLEILSRGSLSQKDLLRELKTVKPFTDALFPSQSLLMRFLTRHSETFVWSEAGNDQPTRIGVNTAERRHQIENFGSPEQEEAYERGLWDPTYTAERLSGMCADPVFRHEPYVD